MSKNEAETNKLAARLSEHDTHPNSIVIDMTEIFMREI